MDCKLRGKYAWYVGSTRMYILTHTPFEYFLSLHLQAYLLLSAFFHSLHLHSFIFSLCILSICILFVHLHYLIFSIRLLFFPTIPSSAHICIPLLSESYNRTVDYTGEEEEEEEIDKNSGVMLYIYENKCVPSQAPVMSRVVREERRDDFRTAST